MEHFGSPSLDLRWTLEMAYASAFCSKAAHKTRDTKYGVQWSVSTDVLRTGGTSVEFHQEHIGATLIEYFGLTPFGAPKIHMYQHFGTKTFR